MATHTPIRIHTANGDFVDDGRTEFDRLVDALERSPAPKLLLHVHGGLVSRNDGDDLADHLDGPFGYELLRGEGWTTGYLVWESALREAIRNNQDELAKVPLLVRYILRLADWILGEDLLTTRTDPEAALVEAIARLDGETRPDLTPVGADLAISEHAEVLADDQLLATNLAAQLRGDAELRKLHAQIEAETAAGTAETAELDPDALERIASRRTVISTMDTRGMTATEVALIPLLVLAGLRVLRRIKNGRDHGAYCTIVEEILRVVYLAKCGAVAWGLMKQDTADHFGKGRPGDLLVEKLFELARAGKPVRVIVVGHSAGAVFASHFAHATARPPKGLTLDYAFLAPALRMDAAADVLANRPAGLHHLRVFTMEDARERRDDLDNTPFGKIYPRSLLYLIAGVLEENARGRSYADAPLVGLQRHLERDTGLNRSERAARAKVAALAKGEVVYAPSKGRPGRESNACTHGSIDREPDNVASLIWLARNGYTA